MYYGVNHLCNSLEISEVFTMKLTTHLLPHFISPVDGGQSDPTQRKSPWHQECEFHLASSHLPPGPPFQKMMDKNYYRLRVLVFTDLVTIQLHISQDWQCTPITALVKSPLLLFISRETCAAVGTQEMPGSFVLTQPLAVAILPDLVWSHRWLGWEERWQNDRISQEFESFWSVLQLLQNWRTRDLPLGSLALVTRLLP